MSEHPENDDKSGELPNSDRAPLFDTHAHIISRDRIAYPPAPLDARNHEDHLTNAFDLDQLIEGMDAAGVAHACAVQRAYLYSFDNSYILDSVKLYPDRLTPVVVLRADDPATPAALREMAARQPIGGLRFSSASYHALDTAWFNSPAAIESWRSAADLGVPVAIIFPTKQLSYVLPALQMIAQLHPDLKIIVDHLGIEHRPTGRIASDRASNYPDPYLGPPDYGISLQLKCLRPLPNIYFKMTGINFERLEDEHIPSAHFLKRFVEEFGADRIMWGSDIGQTPGPYTRLAARMRSAGALLTDGERRSVFHDTAAALYPLPGRQA